jgi:hypothetical protein
MAHDVAVGIEGADRRHGLIRQSTLPTRFAQQVGRRKDRRRVVLLWSQKSGAWSCYLHTCSVHLGHFGPDGDPSSGNMAAATAGPIGVLALKSR